jgi:MFS family permease
MPSILSRIAPAGVKGSVMGIYSSSQFFGAFAGGALGGFIASHYGEQAIFLVMSMVSVVWLLITLGMAPLKKSKNFSFAVKVKNEKEADKVAEQLITMPGVIEATIVFSEAIAYLKIDEKIVNIDDIKTFLNTPTA